MNYKEKILNLQNRKGVNSPIGYIEDLHRTVRLFDERKSEEYILLKSIYDNYDNLKTRAKKR